VIDFKSGLAVVPFSCSSLKKVESHLLFFSAFYRLWGRCTIYWKSLYK